MLGEAVRETSVHNQSSRDIREVVCGGKDASEVTLGQAQVVLNTTAPVVVSQVLSAVSDLVTLSITFIEVSGHV